jgi:hypothetical protein
MREARSSAGLIIVLRDLEIGEAIEDLSLVWPNRAALNRRPILAFK